MTPMRAAAGWEWLERRVGPLLGQAGHAAGQPTSVMGVQGDQDQYKRVSAALAVLVR